MEYKVKLASLPTGVVFSERLRERCSYNAERGELIYRGFMTKCAYDEISALSDDLDYHRAVEHLFVLTSAEMTPPTNNFPMAGAMATVAVAAILAATILLGVWRFGGGERSVNPPANATVSTSP
jgi:hypothetical protein